MFAVVRVENLDTIRYTRFHPQSQHNAGTCFQKILCEVLRLRFILLCKLDFYVENVNELTSGYLNTHSTSTSNLFVNMHLRCKHLSTIPCM